MQIDENTMRFYNSLNPRSEVIILDNLEKFLIGAKANPYVLDLQENCEKIYSKLKFYDKKVTNLLKYNLHYFVNDINDMKRTDIKDIQLRTLVLDYYFDDYINTMLIPFLIKNKDSDINRARHKLAKVKCNYPDHKQMLNAAEYKLENILEIYNHNWENDFRAMKQINKMIKTESKNANGNMSDYEIQQKIIGRL